MVNAKEGLLMPRFKEMVCPVCGKTDFDLPKGPGKENKLRYYGQGRIVCYYCGWIYDANQAANPESKRGQNELSVVEMREDYQARIAKGQTIIGSLRRESLGNPMSVPCVGSIDSQTSLLLTFALSAVGKTMGWKRILRWSRRLD